MTAALAKADKPLRSQRVRSEVKTALETARLQRYRDVEDKLVTGKPGPVVARELSQEWGVTRFYAMRYIAAVQAMWLRDGQRDAGTRKAEHRQRILRLLDLATEEGFDDHGKPIRDLRAAAQLVDLLAKIDGLYDASGPSGEKVNIEAVHVHLHRFYGISQVIDATVEP